MPKPHAQQQRLQEVSRLVGNLTEEMMTAYVVGSSPPDSQVIAFCRGVLLLEEHSVPLPHFANDVIARLQARDDALHALKPVQATAPTPHRPSMLDRLLRPFRMPQAA